MKESINLIVSIPKEEGHLDEASARLAHLVPLILLFFEAIFICLLLIRSRFDDRVFALKTSIEQKKVLLSKNAELENNIRSIQEKLLQIKMLSLNRLSFSNAVNYIPTIIPEDVTLTNVNLDLNKLQISAKTTSGASFARMVENFIHSTKFSDLTLNGSSFDEQISVYTFDFEAKVEESIFK